MTDLANDDAPVFALVDDHVHSARLFSRTLRDADAPAQVKWLGTAARAVRSLERMLEGAGGNTPDLIVVDLKTDSAANENFVARIAPQARSAGVPVAVMAAGLDTGQRERLLAAGAAAIFERHPDLEAYRHEVGQISSFWVRETDTWPIRA